MEVTVLLYAQLFPNRKISGWFDARSNQWPVNKSQSVTVLRSVCPAQFVILTAAVLFNAVHTRSNVSTSVILGPQKFKQ